MIVQHGRHVQSSLLRTYKHFSLTGCQMLLFVKNARRTCYVRLALILIRLCSG